MRLLLLRHGDPDYAHDCLTEKGKVEAELLSERLAGEGITKIYVSPLGRAVETAAPTLEKTGLTSETVSLFREFPLPIKPDYPSHGLPDYWEGHWHCPWHMLPQYADAERGTLFDARLWRDDPVYDTSGITGMYDNICAELDRILVGNGYTKRGLLYDIAPGCDRNAVVAVFCHMGLGLLLIAHLTDIPLPLMWQNFTLDTSSLTEFRFEPTRTDKNTASAYVTRMGDTSHLYRPGATESKVTSN